MRTSSHPSRAVRSRERLRVALVLGASLCALSACATVPPTAPAPTRPIEAEREVEATAYNSLPGQTEGDPGITAFGRRLRPGMRVLAVSNDLYESGLREGVRVTIEGLPGEWEVADRMPARWRNKIDVYMGVDEAAAHAWGVRHVKIRWRDAR